MPNSNGKHNDNRMVLFRSLAAALMSFAVGAGVGREWPSAVSWLGFLGVVSATVFFVLAQAQSKKLASKHS
jgi:hypothetical protein